MEIIELLRVLYCTPFLIYSCYTDIMTRRVSNRVWKYMLAGGAIFIASDLINGGMPALLSLLFSAGFMYAFSWLIFKLGGFGGADAKSLIVLAVIIPVYPKLELLGFHFPLKGIPILDLFAFSVLGNALVLTIVVPISLLIYNLVTLRPREIFDRPAYILVGFKTSISKLPGRHLKLIEEYCEEEGKVQTRFRRRGLDIDEGTVKELERFAASGLIGPRVWVTPGLPFMISITLGFFAAVLVGDLIFIITKTLLMVG